MPFQTAPRRASCITCRKPIERGDRCYLGEHTGMTWRQSTGRESCLFDAERVAHGMKHRFVVVLSGCWEYTGSIVTGGYGVWRLSPNKRTTAHRHSYALAYGPIPDGLQIDHMCRNRRCVNPLHLRACTPRENVLAPWSQSPAAFSSRKTSCPRGHEYAPDRAFNGQRVCIVCKRDRVRKTRQLLKDRGLTVRGTAPVPGGGRFQKQAAIK